MTAMTRTSMSGIFKSRVSQLGLTMIELIVSIAISVTVLGGVVQVLVVSKSNFVTERELSGLQENARFAIKYLSDQIRMAGFSGCSSTPPNFANSINNSASLWYASGLGLRGYEFDAGINTFPAAFSADVADNTDAIVIRKGEDIGLRVSGAHVAASAVLPVNKAHSFKPGQPFVVAFPSCLQVGIFQSSGPTNTSNTATTIEHATGSGVTQPGNCVANVSGNFSCSATSGANLNSYPSGSRVMALQTEAYYVGVSESDATVPALFRERIFVNASAQITSIAEELVQGVELMHIEYGLDLAGDNGEADIYVQGNSGSMNWDKVVTVRLFLRMRSVNPVYNDDTDYDEFQGIDDTDGSDRFMRQLVATTIRIRNA